MINKSKTGNRTDIFRFCAVSIFAFIIGYPLYSQTSVNATLTSTNVTCNGTTDGTIIISSPTGGSGIYEYTINGGATWLSSANFTLLTPATYNVQMRDAGLVDGLLYSNRKKITIDKSHVDTDLTNFPVKVELSLDAEIGAVCNPNGFDIRFTSSNGSSLLKYERESFSVVAGKVTGVFWVKVPAISSSVNTDIYIYYRSAVTSDGADPANVWDSDFKGVWHLNNGVSVLDATSNLNTGTPQNGPSLVAGKILQGLSFNGTDQVVTISNSASLSPTSGITISGWIKRNSDFTTSSSYNEGIIDKGDYQFYLDKIDGKAKWVVNDNTAKAFSALGIGMNGSVFDLVVWNGNLYAGGNFTTAGGIGANNIAKWDGASWSTLGTGTSGIIYTLTVWNGNLYAGGSFITAGGISAKNIAKWDGTSWSALGTGMNNNVYSMAVYNGNLYVGGNFTTVGGMPINRITKWDGASWSALGSGMDSYVYTLAVLNGKLYAAGAFTTAGGISANAIAQWDGASWSTLGSGVAGIVRALGTWNGNLYVGGTFVTAGGVTVNNIAKWDGASWSALGTGMNFIVWNLVVWNGNLYVGGGFTTAGGVSANYIANWDGTSWSALGTGMNLTTRALVVLNGNLYACGLFTTAGGLSANYIANWGTSNTTAVSSTITSWTSGSWYHITGTYDGNNLKVYVNGDLNATSAASSFTLNSSTSQLLLASTFGNQWAGGSGEKFLGSLDEVRISGVSRSASWIKFEYNNMNTTAGDLTFSTEEQLFKVLDPALVITEPAVLNATLASTNVTCNGANDGTITISSPAGGYGTYEYTINGGTTWQASGNFTALVAATYNVQMRDAAQTTCTKVLNAALVITQPAVLNATLASTNVTCNGANDGAITISSPTGGYGTYEYTINGGTTWQAFGSFTALVAATYNVQMRDAAHTSCTKVLNAALVIIQPAMLNATLATTNVTCNGAENGTITLSSPTGGSGTYKYTINGGTTWLSSGAFTALAPATYNVRMSDAALVDSLLYSNRKKITISKTNVSSDLTNFPVKVELSLDAEIGAVCNPNGFDIRFTSSDGSTLLKYERESFSVVAGKATGVFWVKVPAISSSVNTAIYIYYRNAVTPDGSDPTNVWDSNFKGVWHLNDGASITDATSNMNNGTPQNSPIAVAGKILQGLSFNGTDQVVTTPNSVSLSPTTAITFSGWIKRNSDFTTSSDYNEGMEDKGDYQFYLDKTDGKAKWVVNDNTVKAFSGLGTGTNAGGSVYALAAWNGNLYAGGYFMVAGGVAANQIAKWNGAAWSVLGTGTNGTVGALAVWKGNLYAGGQFTTAGGVSVNYVAKWDGTTWSALGTGMNATVACLAVWNGNLYAGGQFTTAGGVSVNHIAKWDGASWSALGTGTSGNVFYLAVWNGKLCVGGTFVTAGGVTVNNIASWDGTTWSALGTGIGNGVECLAVWNGNLYAGGIFSTAGGISANYIARWDGASWSALGTGMNNWVLSLTAWNANLYAGGLFTSAGGVTVNRISKWDGASWSALGTGTNGGVWPLTVWNGNLYVGGNYSAAGGLSINNIAKWGTSNTTSVSSTTTAWTSGSWYHVAGTYDGSNLKIYVNGALQATSAASSFALNTSASQLFMSSTFGNQWAGGSGERFTGTLDEVRISGVGRSASWIKFEYNNMNSTAGELTFGVEETPVKKFESATPPCSKILNAALVITQPAELNAAITVTNVICNGGSDGSITISSPAGGSGTYEYSIDGGTTWQASGNFTTLTFATYNVQIRDAAQTSCIKVLDGALVVTQPAPLNANVTPTNVTCNGANDGSIFVNSATGGHGTYEYSKNGGTTWQASGVFNALAPATYDVRMRDAAYTGCAEKVLNAALVITEPAVLNATLASVNVSCNGSSDGTITISSPTGGYGTFQYTINGGTTWQASGNFAAVAPGSYNVKMRDAAHITCTKVLNAALVITQPAVLNATLASTNISCNGSSDGTITISSPTGGYGTYEYTINGGTSWQASGNYTALAPASYNVRMRDAAHITCTKVLNAALVMTQPAVLNATLTSTNVTCNGSSDGTITISSPTGGYGTFGYSVNGGTTWQASGSFAALASANYNVQMRDAAHTSCTKVLNAALVITQPAVLNATLASTNVTCNGANDGAIIISSPIGGYGTYEYTVNGGTIWQASGSYSSLAPASYNVQVRDAAHTSCAKVLNAAFVITQPPALNANLASTNVICNGSNDGTITISSPTGGYGTYKYTINGGTTWQGSGNFPTLAPASYNVQMRDASLVDSLLYSNRKKITIDKSHVDSDLTNFPVKVELSLDAEIGAVCNPSGFDLRFTSSDGSTLLKYERESFSVVAGKATGIFWVKVPSISSSVNTDIYIYYRSAVTPDGADQTNVWDSDFKGVWHLNNGVSVLDATSNMNTGTPQNGPSLVTGKILQGLSFNGTDQVVTMANSASLSPTSGTTISGWIKRNSDFTTSSSYNEGIIDKGDYQFYLDKIDGKAKWVVNDNTAKAFSALGAGLNNWVWALAVWNGNLYAGGNFTTADGVTVNRITKWDGVSWSTLGTGMNNTVYALTVWNGNLYAAGNFTTAGGVGTNRIAKWDGTSWSALGTGTNSDIYSLAVWNGNLYAGGSFTTAGGLSANSMAKWDGASWSALGSGMDFQVYALGVWNGNLYAGGNFLTAGGISANCIAKWNGASWSTLGSGIVGSVRALASWNGNLYVGGSFATAGGLTINNIAKWDGASWSALGTGMNSTVVSLAVWKGNLCAGGAFTLAGGTSANYIAVWSGASWSALGTGTSNSVRVFEVFNSNLYAGGLFTTAGGVSANYIAMWGTSNTTAVSSTITSWTSGSWYYITSTYDGNNLKVYVNGTLDATSAASSFTLNSSTSQLLIASTFGSQWAGGSGERLIGAIDEIRISGVARSAPWIKFEYNNMNSTAGDLTFGTEETPAKKLNAANPVCTKILDPALLITEPAVLNATLASTNVTCNGSNDGTITITSPTGGYGTYQYTINGGTTWQGFINFSALPPATYNVQMRDAAHTGCTKVLNAALVITEPAVLGATLVSTNLTCNGANDGTITIGSPTGGYGTYQYTINGGTTWQASGSFAALAPTAYFVWMRDAAHTTCTKVLNAALVITQPAVLNATLVSTNVTCNGANDGTITISSPTGGYGTYEYTVNGGTTWQASGSFIALAPGSYNIQMRDAAHISCIKVLNAALVITEPLVLNATLASTNVSCNGANDGTITISSPTGGYGTYEYTVNGGTTWQVSGNFINLANATYNVQMRDAAHISCAKVLNAALLVTEPAVLNATLVSTNVTCNGANDGTITISLPTGGYGTYEYTVNGGTTWQASGNFTALAPASYNVQMRDAAHISCIKVLNAALVLTEPAVLNATLASINVTCNGANDGTITISSPTGGYGTYEFTINGGTTWQASGNFTALAPATYDVRMRDAAHPGCNEKVLNAALVITEPAVLNATLASTNVTCNGANDGTITISSPTGGYGTYEFTINGGTTWQASGSFIALAPGSYNAQMRDAAHISCTKVLNASLLVTEPAVLNATLVLTNVTCNGANDGTMTISSPTGGYGTYEYNVNGGTTWQTSGSFIALAPGSYNIQMRDAAHISCRKVLNAAVLVTEPAVLNATLVLTNVTCNGANDGTITISSPTGGYGTYEYTVNGGTTWQVSGSFIALAPGSYNIQMRDAAHISCTKVLNAALLVTEPAVLNATLVLTNVTCNGANDGTITISSPTGGYGTYEYTVNGGTTWQASGNFSALAPAIYSVQLRDAAHISCIKVLNAALVITEPPALNAALASTNVTCNGANDGTITISSPTGGYGTYEYTVNGGTTWQASGSFSALAPATYSVQMRDAAHTSCTKVLDAALVITEPTVLNAALASTNVSCNGANDGTITISSPSGGYGTYEYSINGGTTWQLSGIYAALAPTLYNVQIRDAAHSGCSKVLDAALVITEPGVLDGTLASTNVTCNGSNDGTITISSPTGGYGTYEYTVNGGTTWQASGSFSALAPATYNVHMRDAANTGCTKVLNAAFVITEPPVLSGIITSKTNVSVFGGNDGSVTVAGSAGTPPYKYKIDSGVYQGSGTFGTLTAGTYTVTVQDINLCTFDVSVTITQPLSALIGTITSQTNVACFSASTGSVTVAGSGGVTPFEYKLGIGSYQPSGVFGFLAAGSYTVTIRDALFVTFDVNVTITQPAAGLGGSITSQTNVLCFGSNTGSVTVSGSGGTPPYKYKIGVGSYQVSGTFGALMAGTYTVTEQDANLCTFNLTVTITQPLATLSGNIDSKTNVLCFGSSDGSVSVSVSGGTSPYEYKLNSGLFQPSGAFNGLAAATYAITVRDANLCTTNISETITEPAALFVSYSKNNASCPNEHDGSIFLKISGGIQPFNVLWSDGLSGLNRLNIAGGTYGVVVTDLNGCSLHLDIVVGSTGSEKCIEIQDIITPNNDGFNDVWEIKNIDLFPNAEVQVFNRWGERVFSTKNISANPWDGTYRGKLLPTDSYHYILNLNDGSEPKTGVVSIIR